MLLLQGGIVLLLMGVSLTVVQKSVGRKLSVELGGELDGCAWIHHGCQLVIIAVYYYRC